MTANSGISCRGGSFGVHNDAAHINTNILERTKVARGNKFVGASAAPRESKQKNRTGSRVFVESVIQFFRQNTPLPLFSELPNEWMGRAMNEEARCAQWTRGTVSELCACCTFTFYAGSVMQWVTFRRAQAYFLALLYAFQRENTHRTHISFTSMGWLLTINR